MPDPAPASWAAAPSCAAHSPCRPRPHRPRSPCPDRSGPALPFGLQTMPVTYDLDSQKRVYATWAKFYDRIYQRMLARPQREAVEAACACGPDILEIGVGTGLTLPYFTAGTRVLGADLSLDMLKVAHRKVASQNL